MDAHTTMEDLSQEQLVQWIIQALRRMLLHYGFWFNETSHQLGLNRACELEDRVGEKALAITMKRLSKVLGFEVDAAGIPLSLKNMPRQELSILAEALGVNWIANDGLWFQEIEQGEEMFTAKRTNDTCWTSFSPYEAFRIRRLCSLPEQSGIMGLRQALSMRMYAVVNRQSFEMDDGGKTLIFRMENCRVQSKRKEKGLDDYPCKSAGMVEYSTFARAIDPRISTACIACPPDPHPDSFFCAWRFTIEKG
ncbi:MAG: DUF6125 family protein [Desulfomonilia bacterium]|nr:DUF6125 family protein [Desulfomonilia bacterium]